MHVALPPDLEQLVAALVQSGRYSSVSEVIREALLLLEEREQRSEVPNTTEPNSSICRFRFIETRKSLGSLSRSVAVLQLG